MKLNELRALIREAVKQTLDENQLALQENLSEYSNDALTDMIVNLSRFEGNEDIINNIKQELEKRKQSKNIKTNKLESYIREVVKQTLGENQPSIAPSKPGTQPDVHPGKPGTDRPKRRPLGNPGVKPKPKAMNEAEQDLVNKIVARFKSKK